MTAFSEVLWRQELADLVSIADPSPGERRRIAELYGLLGDDETAYVWWGYAAATGDREALDMMETLTEAKETQP